MNANLHFIRLPREVMEMIRIIVPCGLIVILLIARLHGDQARPNIVWISAEDMSASLGCYGDTYATTPNLDQLAAKSTRFSNAFATAPVCSPARCCLITGMYATTLGTQRLRSSFPIPDWCEPFPALLRRAGYFTSNNVKTDYNVQDEADVIALAWDRNGSDAHWRQRDKNQPFFAVFNLMTTHQSRTGVWPREQFEREVASQLSAEQRHDPDQVLLPPYYPDTPTTRRGMARYYDCVARMDQQVGQILAELEQDGLSDETIVFFFSDHGMGMPRGKRVLHDSGMHVPLLIYVPEKYRDRGLHPHVPICDDLVSFVDFAPTVLSLADIEVPSHLQGVGFLGHAKQPRDYVYGARDRVDEVDDLSRSVRDQRYLYIRNYMPHLSWMPPEWYSDQSDMRREFFRLRDAGRLNATQLTYAAPTRSEEELYDCVADPHQVKNLVHDPQHQNTLRRMRAALVDWQRTTRDLGFLPESQVWERLQGDTPWDVAQDPSRYPIESVLAYVSPVGEAGLDEPHEDDAALRFWRIVRERRTSDVRQQTLERWTRSLVDEAACVRIEAAAAILAHQPSDMASQVLMDAIREGNVDSRLRAMRAVELNREHIEIDRESVRAVHAEAERREKANEHPC